MLAVLLPHLAFAAAVAARRCSAELSGAPSAAPVIIVATTTRGSTAMVTCHIAPASEVQQLTNPPIVLPITTQHLQSTRAKPFGSNWQGQLPQPAYLLRQIFDAILPLLLGSLQLVMQQLFLAGCCGLCICQLTSKGSVVCLRPRHGRCRYQGHSNKSAHLSASLVKIAHHVCFHQLAQFTITDRCTGRQTHSQADRQAYGQTG